jgi:hypothetical protein
MVVALAMCAASACAGEKAPLPGPDYGPENGGKDDSVNRPATLVPLAFDQVVRTTFTRTRHFRAFKFSGVAGQKIDLFVDGLDGLDTVLYLYRSSRYDGRPFGQPIAVNDDTGQPGWTLRSNSSANPTSSSVSSVQLHASRDHVLVASTYDPAATGAAEVRVSLSAGGGSGAAAWEDTARATFVSLVQQPGTDYLSNTSHAVSIDTVPRAALGDAHNVYDFGNGVVWAFTANRQRVYAVMAEQDDRFVASLFDAGGRWFAHGYAIANGAPPKMPITNGSPPPPPAELGYGVYPGGYFAGSTFVWNDNDPGDPTLCFCGAQGDTCTRIDGTTFGGDNDCD